MTSGANLCISSAKIIKLHVLHLFLTGGLEPVEVASITFAGSVGVVPMDIDYA